MTFLAEPPYIPPLPSNMYSTIMRFAFMDTALNMYSRATLLTTLRNNQRYWKDESDIAWSKLVFQYS